MVEGADVEVLAIAKMEGKQRSDPIVTQMHSHVQKPGVLFFSIFYEK
jgi:hypothetical protein